MDCCKSCLTRAGESFTWGSTLTLPWTSARFCESALRAAAFSHAFDAAVIWRRRMRRAALEAGAVVPSHAMAGTKFVRVFAPRSALAAANAPGHRLETKEDGDDDLFSAQPFQGFNIPLSYALAPSSAESNVPSHKRIFCVVSLISATHLPDGRCRTPTNRFLLFTPALSSAAASGLLEWLSALRTSEAAPPASRCLFMLLDPAP
jgi:hypothetical protein